MVEFKDVNAKLSNSQLNKVKNAVKDKQGANLRMNNRMSNGNSLPDALLLTTRQTTKVRNGIKNNISIDTKMSKAQISKMIQSGCFFGRLLGPILKTGLPLIKM